MNKPGNTTRGKGGAKRLGDIAGRAIDELFARQGFASRELVTRWSAVVGEQIAAHCEPVQIKWARAIGDAPPDPATLVLRVEGPMTLDIQHQSDAIIARINRFLGWAAIGRLAFRQAPLVRETARPAPKSLNDQDVAEIAETLTDIADADLRAALARLGAALKGT